MSVPNVTLESVYWAGNRCANTSEDWRQGPRQLRATMIRGVARHGPRAESSHEELEAFMLEVFPDRFLDQLYPDSEGANFVFFLKCPHANLHASQRRSLDNCGCQVNRIRAQLDFASQAVGDLVLAGTRGCKLNLLLQKCVHGHKNLATRSPLELFGSLRNRCGLHRMIKGGPLNRCGPTAGSRMMDIA